MAMRIESLAEPIPGYRLIERLGGGGFGEVWKCEAPGGLFKAIKFVYGDLEASDEEGARAEQELKALSRVKTVRHAYILSLERYDIIDGRLIIVSELADRTLWDRFRECRTQNLPGIPRAELLGYMEETAEALDLMNTLYQLQHLDIKPQNLFLVHNHIKVADFGLVKDLEGMMASVTGGVTPVYAAPETFDGKVTRFSDQYSLAIVYQEVLTGSRPFTGANLRQLLVQHLNDEPDLSSLPAADRLAVGRALSKSPDQRFPSCQEFVRALRADAAAPPVVPTRLTGVVATPPSGSQPTNEADSEKTQGNPRYHQEQPAPAPEAAPSTPPPRDLPTPPVPVREAGPRTPCLGPPTPVASPRPARREPAVEGSGVLRPALVIGLGRLGLGVLRHFRNEIAEQFSDPAALPHVRLLYIDTDPETAGAAARGRPEVALRPGEILLARLQRPSHYLKPTDHGALGSWLPQRMLYRISRHQTPSGVRALGRLGFVENYRVVSRRVEGELEECCRPEPLQRVAVETGLGVRSGVPRVYVVTGLAGGTGAGMFLDLAYTVRRLLREQGYERGEIVGVFLLPALEPPRKGDSPPAQAAAPSPAFALDPARTAEFANAFAALTELGHFADSSAVFQARYDVEGSGKLTTFTETGPPFERCMLFGLPDPRGAGTVETADSLPPLNRPTERVLGLAGRLLFAELATPLGRSAEHARRKAGRAASPAPYRAVGMYRILWPRRQLLNRAAQSVCRRLVERWMSKDARPVRDGLGAWVQEKWEQLGLDQKTVIGRLQEACARDLGQPPESVLAAVVRTVLPPSPSAGRAGAEAPAPAAVCEAVARLEALLGVPEEERTDTALLGAAQATTFAPPRELSRAEQALADRATALRDETEQKLAELVVRLIEDPQYRLAGAEEALRQLSNQVETALTHHEELARELQDRALTAYQRLQQLLGTQEAAPQTTPSRRAAFLRRAPADGGAGAELIEVLRNYPKWRYQSLVLQRVNTLYLSLRGQMSDQLREVDYCRARLNELLSLLAEPNGTALPAGGKATAWRCLLPPGCRTFEDGIRRLERAVTADELVELDRRVQPLLRKRFKALVQVCMTSGTVLRTLAPMLLQEARTFLEPHLDGSDVTALYLAQHESPTDGADPTADPLRKELLSGYEKAAPAPRGSEHAAETFLLGAPASPAGQEFRGLTREALGVSAVLDAVTEDEIVLYRERALALTDLEQLGPVGQEAYRRALAQDQFTPHARIDIRDWHPAGAAR